MKKKSEWKRTYEIYFKTCHLFLNDGYKTLHVGILLLLLLTSKESNNKKKQGEKDEKDVIRRWEGREENYHAKREKVM